MLATAVPSMHKRNGTRLAAILAASVMLCWPAIWNRFPLLFPDSLGYLLAGRGVWTKLIGIPTPIPAYASDRSEIFEAALFLLHRGAALGTFVMVLGLLTAWILWLLCRSFVPGGRLVRVYFALILLLSFTTGAAWYVSAILADALGPVLYFSVYLLIFAADKLTPCEKRGLYLVAFWAAASHPTHLLVASACCAVLCLLWLCGWKAMRGRGVGLAAIIIVLLTAVAAQVGVHCRLYHRISVFGNSPAFLMARLLGDGPARDYLQANCGTLSWTICAHRNNLPANEVDFLWPANSIWRTSNWDQQEHLRAEQSPLLLATLRSYPKQQMAISWHNFTYMLFVVGPADFGDSPIFAKRSLNMILPGLGDRYVNTRQSRNQMPQYLFRCVQRLVLAASMFLAVVCVVWLYRSGRKSLFLLTAMTLFILPVNAFLGGVISCNDARLQDRVSWMIVVVAILILVSISQVADSGVSNSQKSETA